MPQRSFFADLARSHQALSDLVMVTKVELDPDEITALMSRLDVTLRHHFAVEDEVLYPTLLDIVEDWEDRTVLLGAHEDHHVMMRILDDLENTDPSDERFRGKVHTLDRLWSHHAEEEEGALFDMARKYLGASGFDELLKKIRAAEKAQKERLEAVEERQEDAGKPTETARRESRQTRS